MANQKYIDFLLQQENSIKQATQDNKIKKFFRVAGPILVLEVIAIVVLLVYLFILPKNYCKITTNMDNAIVYVNNQETTKFRFDEPKEELTYYFYGVDISLELPSTETYLVSFTVSCNKYDVFCSTDASKVNNVYSMQIEGGQKTQIIRGVTIKSDKMIKNFDVDVNIDIQKI